MDSAGLKILVISIGLICAQSNLAQSWQRFSPPDQSFIIELPTKPNLVRNEEDSPVVLFKDAKATSGYAYSVNLGFKRDPELIFGVAHLSRRLRDSDFDKTVNDLMLVVGGDDKHFSKESNIVVGGFHGRDFVYDKGDTKGRALFLNGGQRVYIMLFGTEVDGALSSDTVERIFNSFRPLK